jgi:hypothetical protein
MIKTLPSEITSLLEPGETVLWQAQPRPYVFMLRGLPTIAYGVTWSVLGAFWYHGSGGIGHDSVWTGWWKLTPLFSLPFILAGFSFFLYPIRLGARARRTWYLVTNRRVLTAELQKKRPPKLQVFRAGPPQVVKRFDGLDNVIFSERLRENPHLTPRLVDGFLGVEKGGEVAETIRGLSSSPPSS